MLTCEEFEYLFPADSSPEILQHVENCPHCAAFSVEIAELRSRLAAYQRINAPLGFEMRLEKRLDEIETGRSAKRMTFVSSAAAFASGVAVVLLAGAIYDDFDHKSPIHFAEEISPAIEVAATAETDSVASDSTVIPLDDWSEIWNINTVSVER